MAVVARGPKVEVIEKSENTFKVEVRYDADQVTGSDSDILITGPGAMALAYQLEEFLAGKSALAADVQLAAAFVRLTEQYEEIKAIVQEISSKQHRY